MKHLIHSFFRRFGLKISHIDSSVESQPVPMNQLTEFMLQLKAAGFAPREILDIGANRGNWTRSVLRIFPDADYRLIEPQKHLAESWTKLLENPRVSVRNCAVSSECGTAKFNVSPWDVTSGLAVDDAAPDGDVEQIEVEILTVDKLIAEKEGIVPDFIKIDAEGHDLEVLSGAGSALGRTEVFLIEAGLCCPHMPNSVSAVVTEMESKGYRLAGIVDINTYQWPQDRHSPGLQWLVDLAFLRDGGALLNSMQHPDPGKLRITPF